MPIVNRSELEDTLDWLSASYEDDAAYTCLATGKIYWKPREEGVIDDLEIPDDLDDGDKYLPAPDKWSLDLGNQLVFDFTREFAPLRYDDIRRMFRRKGAYGRFKDFLEKEGLLDKWYRYQDEQTAKALAAWCEENGLKLGP